jgi:hypothetical protein
MNLNHAKMNTSGESVFVILMDVGRPNRLRRWRRARWRPRHWSNRCLHRFVALRHQIRGRDVKTVRIATASICVKVGLVACFGFLLLPGNFLLAQVDKKDIQGFTLGSTQDLLEQQIAKFVVGKVRCETGPPHAPNVISDVVWLKCYPNATTVSTSSSFEFFFTSTLDMPVVKWVKYEFRTEQPTSAVIQAAAGDFGVDWRQPHAAPAADGPVWFLPGNLSLRVISYVGGTHALILRDEQLEEQEKKNRAQKIKERSPIPKF